MSMMGVTLQRKKYWIRVLNFSAVIASNDESALGVIAALKQAGRKIPHDVAIIGFDNRLEGALQDPALTSIHVPLFNIGYQAVNRLFQHITGEIELEGTDKLDTRLVIRKSCGCNNTRLITNSSSSVGIVQSAGWEEKRLRLANSITTVIMNEARGLTEDECLAYCLRLIDSFVADIQHGSRSNFGVN